MKKFLKESLEFWMTNLPESLRSIPVIYLAIPGSHDSTTYALNKKSSISPDARNPLQYLKCLQCILRPAMIKWSRTQSANITQQLISGIRYFDLRIAMKPSSFGFYFVHNLYSESVTPVLELIDDFLESHPHEIVVLDCQHFYNMSTDDHHRFISLLTLIFGHKVLPYFVSMTHITLDYMTKENLHQVIIVYRSDVAIVEELLWPGTAFPNPWPDTVEVPQVIKVLNEGLRNRDTSFAFISQILLTPTVWFAFKNLFSSLKNKCVLPLEKAKYEWLQQLKNEPGGVNIVICDFIDSQDFRFPREIVNLNFTRKLIIPKNNKIAKPKIKAKEKI